MKKFMMTLCVFSLVAMGTIANASDVTITVGEDGFAGEFWDLQGSANNETGTVSFDAGAEIIGIEWDVVTTSLGASWGSEQVFSFGDTLPGALNLTPSGSDEPVTGEANSGSALFADFGIANIVVTDGVLEYELFESFDDVTDEQDGLWEAGSSVTFIVAKSTIPEPTTAGFLALAGVAGLARRRR